MSEYIRTINEADAAAKLFKQGKMTAVELEERLTELGFYNITFSASQVYVTVPPAWTGRLELGNV